MSITGSLVGFENNNEINSNKKNRSLLNTSTSKPCPSLNSSISNSVITSASCSSSMKNHHNHQKHLNQQQQQNNKNQRNKIHLNSLWSIWYGILVTLLQGYLAIQGAHRFLSCSILQWTKGKPTTELDIQIILCGFVIILLPIFLTSALFKVGNLANDGVKLATGKGKCSTQPTDSLEKEGNGETLRNLWTHGGPTSAFIHIVTALCLLCPRLFLEARLIENGILTKEQIWRTELDFMVTHRDRLVILSFMTSPYQNSTNTFELYNETSLNRPTSFFEHTNLIERFRPEIDDLEFDNYENSHENIEMKQTENNDDNDSYSTINYFSALPETSKLLQTTLPPLLSTTLTTPKVIAITTTTTTIPITTMTIKNITPKTIPNIKLDVILTENTNLESTKESFNAKEGNTSTHLKKHGKQNNNNSKTHQGGGTGGGNVNHRNHKKQNHRHRNEETQSSKGHKKDRQNHRKDTIIDDIDEDFIIDAEEIDDHLELKPQRGINFDLFDDTSTKIIEFQKPPPSTNKNTNKKNMNKQKLIASTTTTTKTITNAAPSISSRDSKIHIVKQPIENLDIDVIIQTTTPTEYAQTTNSKIFEIKPASNIKNTSSRKIVRRYTNEFIIDEDDSITRNIIETNRSFNKTMFEISSPMALVGQSTSTAGNITNIQHIKKLEGFAGFLQEFLGVKDIDANKWMSLPSLEFLNLSLAIMVWSVRYPAVFWATSKSFASIFSVQMVANAFDILLGYAGISVLYKLQINNPQSLQLPSLLLNAIVTISLFIFATLLVISSSMILYLYGHGRLVSKIRNRDLISIKLGDTWIYFAHCASLCFVLALAVVKAPLLHDLSTTYRNSLDGAVLAAALGSVIHLFLWIILWLGLTAKRRWSFKIPPIEMQASQPLLQNGCGGQGCVSGSPLLSAENTIYWPKLTPSSPKLKVTFNEVPSTSSHHDIMVAEHDKRHKIRGATIYPGIPGEPDDGDYATLRGPTGDLLHMSNLDREVGLINDRLQCIEPLIDDNTSEEGKLLESVRDDSVTYASTRDLEPPIPSHSISPETFIGSPEKLLSPLAPVTVTVHTNEIHISTISTPRCLRRGDSGVPNEALTPRSDTTSTESSTSPPDRAPSESSSGVHSGEEREEVIIRPRPNVPYKPIIKQPPPAIQEEPFGRSTCMKMSSFKEGGVSSATLPLTRGTIEKPEQYCNTMPLPVGCHQQYRPNQQQQQPQQIYSPNAPKSPLHTTLPNGVRYTQSNQFLRRLPHMKNAESPYGHLGLGSGHHTFSKLLHEPLHSFGISQTIPEDRDSANYSNASSENDNSINIQRDIYIHSGQLQIN